MVQFAETPKKATAAIIVAAMALALLSPLPASNAPTPPDLRNDTYTIKLTGFDIDPDHPEDPLLFTNTERGVYYINAEVEAGGMALADPEFEYTIVPDPVFAAKHGLDPDPDPETYAYMLESGLNYVKWNKDPDAPPEIVDVDAFISTFRPGQPVRVDDPSMEYILTVTSKTYNVSKSVKLATKAQPGYTMRFMNPNIPYGNGEYALGVNRESAPGFFYRGSINGLEGLQITLEQDDLYKKEGTREAIDPFANESDYKYFEVALEYTGLYPLNDNMKEIFEDLYYNHRSCQESHISNIYTDIFTFTQMPYFNKTIYQQLEVDYMREYFGGHIDFPTMYGIYYNFAFVLIGTRKDGTEDRLLRVKADLNFNDQDN